MSEMHGLLQVAEVAEGDGNWSAGLEVEALQCGLVSMVSDVCLPTPGGILAGSPAGTPAGYKLAPFGVLIHLREPTRCRTSDPEAIVREAAVGESEKAVGRALWYGTNNTDMWLGSPEVETVSTTTYTTEIDQIARALERFYAKTVGVEPIVHLGIGVALRLGDKIDELPSLRGTGTKLAVSPGYPVGGIAVTGPVQVWLGSVQTFDSHEWGINRASADATRLAAIAFDPCAVLVVGEPPVQMYVADDGLDVTAYVSGNEAEATIDWGDASVDGTVDAGGGEETHTYAEAGTYTITVSHSGSTRTLTTRVN